MLEPRGAGAEWQRIQTFFGSIAAEQSDAHAGNGLDVSAYPCVGVAARNRKNYCVHRSPLCPIITRREAVDSTRTQPFVPNFPDVVQLGRSMTKVSATWNIHEAGPFSES
jgi:hypothetical protein